MKPGEKLLKSREYVQVLFPVVRSRLGYEPICYYGAEVVVVVVVGLRL